MSTRTTARDAILGQFKTAWDADAASTGIPVFYWDSKRNRPVDDKQAYARINLQHALGDQDAVTNGQGQDLFIREGVLNIQIFTPTGSGLTQADLLAKVAVDAFEGQNNGDIWFRNVRVNEIGIDGDRYQTNVLVDFTYDETR